MATNNKNGNATNNYYNEGAWELRLSVSGDYWQVYHNDELVYADSANEDMYDFDCAVDMLHSLRDEQGE